MSAQVVHTFSHTHNHLHKHIHTYIYTHQIWAAYRRSLELGGENSNVGPGRSSTAVLRTMEFSDYHPVRVLRNVCIHTSIWWTNPHIHTCRHTQYSRAADYMKFLFLQKIRVLCCFMHT
jgi:hypothetical protein